MWKAMDCCAKQLFVVTKIGQIFVFPAFYKEQECKNCASGKTVQDSSGEGRNWLYCSSFGTTKAICRSPYGAGRDGGHYFLQNAATQMY